MAERIYNMYVRERLSYIRIAEQLNAEGIPGPRGGRWPVSMVARIIKDHKYKGVAYNRTVVWSYVDGKKVPSVHPNPTPVGEGVVPAIFSEALWEQARERRRVAKTEAKRRNKQPHTALLRTGYVRCGYCGSVMCALNTHHNTGNYAISTSYKCNSRKTLHKVACKHQPSIGAVGFDVIVWKFLGEILEHFDLFKEALQLKLSDVQGTIASYDDLIRMDQEKQERMMQDLRPPKEERTRSLILAGIDSLSTSIAKYQEQRLALLPASKQAEQNLSCECACTHSQLEYPFSIHFCLQIWFNL